MKPCVLIVDDSLTVRMDLKEAFESSGFDVIHCATVESAQHAIEERDFDVAILDVLLPDGDGLALLQQIKSAPAADAVPVLLLSTEDEVRDRVRGLKTGADDYVGKPYDTAQVVGRARELVQRERMRHDRNPHILVIDDSATYAAELRAVLVEAGYEVSVAGSGEEGLRVAAGVRPEAMIVDQMLPGIDGVEVIRNVRADAVLRRTPCMLLTASERRSDELRALEAGADAFGNKLSGAPVVLAKLAALLRSPRDHSTDSSLASLLAPKRILAVDDSSTFLGELCDQLRAEGYDAVAAHSGAEALELLGTQPVDGILLDLLMPELSGQETCRRIKSEPAWRDTPLIILTALDESEAMIEGINAGADDYIAKSADFEILKARLRAQLRRRQFEDENRAIREQLHRREMEAVEMQALRELSETRAALIQSLEQKNQELACANEALRRAKEAVETVNQELESFSYSVSHDLRAPLRAINGFSELLMEHCGETVDGAGRRYLKHIADSTLRMGQLIEDMLALSRVTRAELRLGPVDLGSIAQDVVTQLRAHDRERRVEVDIAPGLVARADAGLMRILLENLLGNAWKFTSKRAEARIAFARGRAGGGGVHDGGAFYVRDNGAGFDMAYAQQLFGPFRRLHSDDDFPGTGVGLATVARVVRRHGGRVWAEAAVDVGATFYFTVAER